MAHKNRNFSIFALLALFLLAACNNSLKDFQKKQEDALRDLAETTSGAAVSDSTSTRAALELRILDSLQRKYPGRTKTVTVTKYERIVMPGQTLVVKVPVKVDSARNKSEVDSLLARIEDISTHYQNDLTLQAEIASVKARLLSALNRRGILPDTTVFFSNAPGYWLRLHRLPAGRYTFTLNTPEKTDSVATQTHVTTHQPPVYIRDPFYVYWQFWTAVGAAVLGWGALGMVIRELRKPQA